MYRSWAWLKRRPIVSRMVTIRKVFMTCQEKAERRFIGWLCATDFTEKLDSSYPCKSRVGHFPDFLMKTIKILDLIFASNEPRSTAARNARLGNLDLKFLAFSVNFRKSKNPNLSRCIQSVLFLIYMWLVSRGPYSSLYYRVCHLTKWMEKNKSLTVNYLSMAWKIKLFLLSKLDRICDYLIFWKNIAFDKSTCQEIRGAPGPQFDPHYKKKF